MADLAMPTGGSSPLASIAVVGGSGFYEFLEDAEELKIDTPFGPPSDPVTVGEVAGRRVAFLPRHGRDHRFPPHKIPYRANMWALRSIGVRRVLAPTAVGSLTPSDGAGAGLGARELRDPGRHRGPALLQPRRIPVVRRAGLDLGRHDRPPRGGPGPRAGPLLRPAGPGHRPGRRP